MKKIASIGIDIGGTSVKLALVDRRGRLLAQSAVATRRFAGRAKLLAQIMLHTQALADRARAGGWTVKGIGIGAPGPVDVERGFIHFFPNIPGWERTPLKQLMQRRFGKPVYVDNDANVMALAELYFGAGIGARSLVALTLGTGVGGGIVTDGRLFHGSTYSASEIGHMIINEDGPRCSCGNRGCIEAYVGNGYFIRWAMGLIRRRRSGLLCRWVLRDGKPLTPELAQSAARKGDTFARGLWVTTASHLSSALASLVNVLNPERIIIGGGIAQAGPMLFEPLRRFLKKKAFPIAVRDVKVIAAKLGPESGQIGAAALVFAGHKRNG